MSVKVAQFLRPFSKGSSALSLKLIIDDLTYRYTKNIKEQIKIKLFKEKELYFVYAKVPSESNDRYTSSTPVFYDVIFQLIPPNKASLAATTIRDYDVKVFSNIPSFLFTFNYVFYQKKALINLPAGYYSSQALNQKAKIRNPLNLLGIDKSLWFTTYYLDDHNLFIRSIFDATVSDSSLTLDKLLKSENIKTQDRKLYEVELREKHYQRQKEHRKSHPQSRRKPQSRNVKQEEVDKLIEHNLASHALKSERASSLRATSFSASTLRQQPKNTLKSSTLKSSLKKN